MLANIYVPSFWKFPPSREQKLRKLRGAAVCCCDSDILDLEKVSQRPALLPQTLHFLEVPNLLSILFISLTCQYSQGTLTSGFRVLLGGKGEGGQ